MWMIFAVVVFVLFLRGDDVIDCDDYDFDKNRPITEFYKDMQEANVPVLAWFMQDVASNQYENQYSGSKFYTTFLDFIEKYKYISWLYLSSRQ